MADSDINSTAVIVGAKLSAITKMCKSHIRACYRKHFKAFKSEKSVFHRVNC